jgi:ubiquitin-protein ligase
MSRNVLKRITSMDMRSIERMDLASLGIHVHFNESDITKAVAMIIGPPGTPYEDGLLFFRIQFPSDYPFSPPKVSYVSTSRIRVHPNLYVGKSYTNHEGKVCLSSLNTWSGPKWTTVMNIASILISLQSILDANPLRNEPGYETTVGGLNDAYNLVVQYDTLKTMILQNGLGDIPFEDMSPFSDIIKTHLSERMPRIILKAQALADAHPNAFVTSVGTYHISERIEFPRVHYELRGYM